jgi:hypothetical protein
MVAGKFMMVIRMKPLRPSRLCAFARTRQCDASFSQRRKGAKGKLGPYKEVLMKPPSLGFW